MKKLVIIGAGGLGREVLWLARECNKVEKRWDILGFIDENEKLHGQVLCDVQVLGGLTWLEENSTKDTMAVCGVGKPSIRKELAEKTRDIGLGFASLIHPSTCMSDYVEVGEGVVVTANNIITTQVTLGDHVFLNLNCTVGHDTVLEDYVNCAPGCNISGNVTLKMGVHIGTQVSILPGVTIGGWSRIGAGATVIDDIPEKSVAVGVPAKVIKKIP